MSSATLNIESLAQKFIPKGVPVDELGTERLWVFLLFGMGAFATVFVLLDFIIIVGPAAWLCATLSITTPLYLWLFKTGWRTASKFLVHLHVLAVLFIITLLYTDKGNAWTFLVPIMLGAMMIFTRTQRISSYIIIILCFLFVPMYMLTHHLVTPLEFDATSMTTFKVLNLSGSMAFSLMIIVTITNLHRKIQKQLRLQIEENDKQNKIMLGSIRTRDKLLSMMSHDVRGDIGKTIGVVDVIEQMPLSKEDQANLLHNLKIDATKTLETLDNMLQWTRTQQDELNIRPENYEVDRLISMQLSKSEFALNSKRINLQLDIPGNLRIMVDINMIDSVFRNLIGNAIKFTPVGGFIAISAKQLENEIEFCIQDSGVGMTAEQMDNILKGVQFTTRGTNREKGRGFGMVLVNEFLAKHKAPLHIESTVGKGSRFTFRLPITSSN